MKQKNNFQHSFERNSIKKAWLTRFNPLNASAALIKLILKATLAFNELSKCSISILHEDVTRGFLAFSWGIEMED